jgi:hypothetical protein
MTGFVAAGFGAWGVVGLESRWRPLARAAAISSCLLLVLFVRIIIESGLGLVVDGIALAIARAQSSSPLPAMGGKS